MGIWIFERLSLTPKIYLYQPAFTTLVSGLRLTKGEALIILILLIETLWFGSQYIFWKLKKEI